MEFDQTFNLGEGILWVSTALVLAFRSLGNKEYRKVMIGAAITFLLFGVSDFVEMRTRAWYVPWTLFALKAACIVSFILHLVFYAKQKKGSTNGPIP